MYFEGVVKTSHKEYPMKHLRHWYNPGYAANPSLFRGSHKVRTSIHSDKDGANRTKMTCDSAEKNTLKIIISNRGTIDQGNPSIRVRLKIVLNNDNNLKSQRYNITVTRPKVIEMLLDLFVAVDIADNLRLGILSMETSWLTKNGASECSPVFWE